MADSALDVRAERREYRRVSDAVALHIEPVDGEAANDASMHQIELPDHPTHVVSLSPNGLKCFHHEAFNDGDMLSITLKLFPSESTMVMRARVVNSGEDKQKGTQDRFFAGLAFKGLQDDQKAQILEHIESVALKSFGGSVKLIYKK
jgi:hypothetical protein